MSKRITYRPNKAASGLSVAVGVIFILIGVTVVIPSAGLFGVLWTLIALGITVANGYQAFGKKYIGPEIRVEDDGAAAEAEPAGAGDVKARLEQLEALKAENLVTAEEYQRKREEILRSL